ncbi:MAG: ferritin family protein [Desulfovibrionales bacterium]|nr:ferritin family protein [Desulfovibrionales bacterium]
MFTLNDLLNIAIKMEENAKTIYLEAAQDTPSRDLKRLLEWMAKEEERHRHWFLDKKQEWKGQDLPSQGIPEELLEEMMGGKGLSLDDVDLSKLQSPQDLLKAFLDFESDAILFYDFLEAFLQDEAALEGLKKIQDEEKKHMEKLQGLLDAQ